MSDTRPPKNCEALYTQGQAHGMIPRTIGTAINRHTNPTKTPGSIYNANLPNTYALQVLRQNENSSTALSEVDFQGPRVAGYWQKPAIMVEGGDAGFFDPGPPLDAWDGKWSILGPADAMATRKQGDVGLPSGKKQRPAGTGRPMAIARPTDLRPHVAPQATLPEEPVAALATTTPTPPSVPSNYCKPNVFDIVANIVTPKHKTSGTQNTTYIVGGVLGIVALAFIVSTIVLAVHKTAT